MNDNNIINHEAVHPVQGNDFLQYQESADAMDVALAHEVPSVDFAGTDTSNAQHNAAEVATAAPWDILHTDVRIDSPVYDRDAHDPTFMENVKAGFTNGYLYENAAGSAFRDKSERNMDKDFEPEEGYDPAQWLKDNAVGVPNQVISDVLETVNSKQAAQIVQRFNNRVQSYAEVHGVGGFLGETVATVLDPTMYLGGEVVRGAAAMQKVSKTALVASAYALGGSGVQETILHATDSNRTMTETALNMATNTAFGFAGGALLGKSAQVEADGVRRAAAKVLDGATDPELKTHYDAYNQSFVKLHDELSQKELLDMSPAQMRKVLKDDPEVAARVKEVADAQADILDKMDWSDYGRLYRTADPEIQWLAMQMFEAPSGHVGVKATHSASLDKYRLENQYRNDVMLPLQEGYREYAAANKWGVVSRLNPKNLGKFNDELHMFMEVRNAHARGITSTPMPEVHPSVKATADAIDVGMQRTFNNMKDAGMLDADAKFYHGYTPRRYDKLAGLKTSQIRDLFANAFASAHGLDLADLDMDSFEKLAQRISAKQENMFANNDLGYDIALEALDDGADYDFIKVHRSGKEEMTNLRSRMDLDVFAQMYDEVTGRYHSLWDYMNHDVSGTLNQYARSSSGRIALARKGFKDTRQLQEYISKIVKGKELTDYQRDILEAMPDFFAGRVGGAYKPLHPAVRRMQQLASAALLGGMGIAQIPEMAYTMAEFGVRRMIASGHFKKFLRDLVPFSKGAEHTQLQDVANAFGGIHNEHNVHRRTWQLDEVGYTSSARHRNQSVSQDGFWGYVDNILEEANYQVGEWSMVSRIKDAQRKLVVDMLGSSIASHAKFNHKLPPGLSRDRRLSMGIGDEEWDGILKNVREHATWNGKELTQMNFMKWDAPAREAYGNALFRTVNRHSQYSMGGETSIWMRGDLASTLLQFLSYPLNAHTKQFLRAAKFRDAAAAGALVYGTLLAAAGTAIRNELNIASQPTEAEMKKKREQLYDPATFVAQTVGYIPALGGIGLPLNFVMSTVFDTGPTGNLMQPVIGSYLMNLSRVPGRFFSDDYTAAQAAAKTVASLPLGTLPAVKIATGALARMAED